jgi:nicotinamide phosphoribosyltransferase
MKTNIILMTDSYKASMHVQYPPGTEYVYSYIEPRGGEWDSVLFFGLQAFIKEYLLTPITEDDIEEAAEFFAAHMTGITFNRAGWDHILKTHNGYLPILIKAPREGSLIPIRNVVTTIVNTDPKCFWLTTYIETCLLRSLWYPSTVATNSFNAKLTILNGLNISSDDPQGQIAFKLHDFGARGSVAHEAASLGGMAHLVNFMGSDTIEGIVAAKRYYNAPMAGFSIAAAEHSTITSWGRDGEVDAYRNMLTRYAKPGSLVAVVSDSYDLMNAVENIWGKTLKQEVIDSGATIVIRPDSGNPTETPVEVLKSLAEIFGFTVNKKGYKVLPSCVRVIQGDGMNGESLKVLVKNILAAGFSIDNIAFGMGGGLLQQVNRDTMKWAMKCSAISINGVWHDVYKDPKTDPGKRSKRGRLALTCLEEYQTVRMAKSKAEDDMLFPVYQDGQLLVNQTFDAIRERANKAAKYAAPEISQGSGLGEILTLEEGKARLAEYAKNGANGA